MPKPTSAPRALVLDLDGTIADTLPHIFNAYRYAVTPWVERPPTDAEIETTFGPSERDCLAVMVPRSEVDQAERRFHAYYEAEHGKQVRAVDGMAAVIERARNLGWKIGVFTGKGRRSAQFTLRELGILPLVDHLVSGDDVKRPKPHPEGVFQIARVLGVAPREMLLVGDSPADIAAGRAAGTRTAAVLWAAFQPERLLQAQADWTCDRVDQLLTVIEQLHAGE